MVLVVAGLGDVYLERPCLAANRRGPADFAAPPGYGFEAGRGENSFRVAVRGQHLARRDGDLATVPVAERLDAAGPVAHHQCAHIDADIEIGRAEVVVHAEHSRPAGGLDGEVMTCLRSQPVTESTQNDATLVGAKLVATRKYRHGSTLGHFWGDVQ